MDCIVHGVARSRTRLRDFLYYEVGTNIISIYGQCCVPSLLLDLRPNCGGGSEDSGHLLQKIPCTHFSSGHVRMWELDYTESWALKNWCFWTVVLEKTLESSLDSKEIQPVHPKRKSVLNIHWKDWCWSWNSNTLATWGEEPTDWKRPWCWERLKVGGEEDDRG